MRRFGRLFPSGFLDDGVRQSETVLGAVFSDSAMFLFIIPSAASKTILARNTSRAGVRLPRVQRFSVFPSSSVSVICRAYFMGFFLRIRMKPRKCQ